MSRKDLQPRMLARERSQNISEDANLLEVGEFSPEQIDHARRVVAGLAFDAQDLSYLLDVLGIGQEPEVRTQERVWDNGIHGRGFA
jgi:hypothetical protein